MMSRRPLPPPPPQRPAMENLGLDSLKTPVNQDLQPCFQSYLDRTNTYMHGFSQGYIHLQHFVNEQVGLKEQLNLENQMLKDKISQLKASLRPWKLHKTYTGLNNAPVHSVDVSGSLFASASWDGSIKVVDLASTSGTAQKAWRLGSTQRDGLYAVGFAKTAPEIIGAASSDQCVYIWNHQTDQCFRHQQHDAEVNDIAFHGSQNVMATASDDGKCIIWDFKEGVVLRSLVHEKQAGQAAADSGPVKVYGTTFLGESHQYLLATCSFDKKTRVWDMRDKRIVKTLTGHRQEIIGIDCSKKDVLATSSDDGTILAWETRSWQRLYELNIRNDASEHKVKRISFSPDGTRLAAAVSVATSNPSISHGSVMLFENAADSQPTLCQTLDGHNDCAFDVAWGVDPTSERPVIVSASHDQTVKVWREEGGMPLQ